MRQWSLRDSIINPVRRRIATRAVEQSLPLRSVLFVCRGNVCRSPFAAAVFARDATQSSDARISVSSAGFAAAGRRPPPAALAAASRRGVDLTRHRSRMVGSPIIDPADLIVVMDAEQRSALRRRFQNAHAQIIILGDLDPENGDRAIRDPVGCDDVVFDETYDRIERCVAGLVRVLSRDAARARS